MQLAYSGLLYNCIQYLLSKGESQAALYIPTANCKETRPQTHTPDEQLQATEYMADVANSALRLVPHWRVSAMGS